MRDWVQGHPRIRALAKSAFGVGTPVFVDDYYAPDLEPRWGHGREPHPVLEQRFRDDLDRYREVLEAAATHGEEFRKLAADRDDEGVSLVENGWFSRLDGFVLYTLLGQLRPARYVEIGSGHSTHWARHAVETLGLPTTIVSIDPEPRTEVDEICDRVLRMQAEQVAPGELELAPGDVLFIDGSHRVLQNSDVVALFLDVLPQLPAGVVVHVHDIFLPSDYPPEWSTRYYSEQYLLAAMLLAAPDRYEVLMPNYFVAEAPELAPAREQLAAAIGGPGSPVEIRGASFWMRLTS